MERRREELHVVRDEVGFAKHRFVLKLDPKRTRGALFKQDLILIFLKPDEEMPFWSFPLHGGSSIYK